MKSNNYQYDKKVLIYCRESRDEYGENYDRIETQRDILLGFCEKNNLTNIVDVIMDDNMTGTSFKRLDEIKRMMVDGRINTFVCKDASRLGRNLLESLKFIEFAEEHGVEIIFESETFDPEIFPLIAWFNERRAKDDSVKIKRVLRHKLENGLVIVPPFGYKKVDGDMVPDQNTAPIVKKIFEMGYKGSTPAQISDYLNIIKAPTPSEGGSIQRKRTNPIWTRDNVRRILKNPVYTGTQIAGKIEKVSYKSRKYRSVPEERRIVIHNHHEALVSQEVFENIQLRIKSQKIPRRNPTFNPLSGMMYCGRCGSSILLRGRRGSMPVKYICAKYNREGLIKDEIRPNWGCNPHAVYYEDIKGLIMDYISHFLSNDSLKKDILAEIEADSKQGNKKDTIKLLNENKTKLQRRFDMLYEDRLNGLIPDFVFRDKSKSITDELERLNAQIELFQKTIEDKGSESLSKKYEKDIEQLKRNGLTSEGISRIFEKIIVYEPYEITEAIKAEYNINDEQYEELYNHGGFLFVQNAPWGTIIIEKN